MASKGAKTVRTVLLFRKMPHFRPSADNIKALCWRAKKLVERKGWPFAENVIQIL